MEHAVLFILLSAQCRARKRGVGERPRDTTIGDERLEFPCKGGNAAGTTRGEG